MGRARGPPLRLGGSTQHARRSACEFVERCFDLVFRGIALLDHYNPAGTVHGGWAATIMDSALGCAVHTKMQPGMGYSTIEFKVHLVRPIFANTGEVICEGRVVHIGRTIATSEATLKTVEGKLLAHGTETCAIFPLKKRE